MHDELIISLKGLIRKNTELHSQCLGSLTHWRHSLDSHDIIILLFSYGSPTVVGYQLLGHRCVDMLNILTSSASKREQKNTKQIQGPVKLYTKVLEALSLCSAMVCTKSTSRTA